MKEKLPIHAVLDELINAATTSDEIILKAPPGAGKTTVVPLKFLELPCLVDTKILLLEPRRIAARNAAARMAMLLDEPIGQTIGYRMRLDTKVGPNTRIEVITEGVLLRMLHDDPTLDGVGMVIFDEFHERSLDADLGLALCLKARELFRQSPLELVFMSATLEGDQLKRFLQDAPVIVSEGRAWPVDITFLGAAKPRERIGERMANALKQTMAKHPEESILAFLPGEGEIREVESALNNTVSHQQINIFPLYGNLSIEAQRKAVEPTESGKQKIVLATNIAESSLTIDGVNIVVDCGLMRQARFDPNTAMSRLYTEKISRASADQRTGRAGRTGPGHCYRLWSKEQDQQLAQQTVPEIMLADLSSMAIALLSWGLNGPEDLLWLDAPPNGAWQQAISQLSEFFAIEQKGDSLLLTAHGHSMAQLPLIPRISHMLVNAKEQAEPEIGCALAALFSERDPFSHSQELGASLTERIDLIIGKAQCPSQHRGWQHRTHKLYKQYLSQINHLKGLDRTGDRANPETKLSLVNFNNDSKVAALIALAFPDRIARKRHAGGYQLANGRSASLSERDMLKKHKWLAVAEVSGHKGSSDIIRSAAYLDILMFEGALKKLTSTVKVVDWDKKQSRFIAEQKIMIGHLVLDRQQLNNLPQQDRIETICRYVASQGLSLFKRYKEFQWLQKRAKIMQSVEVHSNTDSVFDLSDERLIRTLETWLAPYLSNISKLDQLQKIDIQAVLMEQIPYAQRQQLNTLVPTHFQVPTGSKIEINYSEEPPILAVKLQEMFGCDTTPTIANGAVALQVHLLSPARRPLQITQDLEGFWRNSYQDVRKDMRGRYPKHPWPEDPTSAPPTKYTKPR